jgi:hypothetical protein
MANLNLILAKADTHGQNDLFSIDNNIVMLMNDI